MIGISCYKLPFISFEFKIFSFNFFSPLFHLNKRLNCFQNKGEKGSSVRGRFLCSPTKNVRKLPDYPREPEPNKTLDMSNIM